MGTRAALDRLLDRFLERYVASDYHGRMRGALREPGEFGVDPFGLDPEYMRYVAPIAWALHRGYFRVQSFGQENLPEGRVLLVANHSGQMPIDGFLIATTLMLDADPPRITRSMVEKWAPTLPFVSVFMARCGQVVGLPENCTRLLQQEETVLVFPEGMEGVTKTWSKRYQLQRFGTGFMRLALGTKTPIVPVAVIGGEEQAPTFYNAKRLGKLLGLPSFPVTPTFPWLFPVGLLPYPVRYRIHFGNPLYFDGDPTDDDESIGDMVGTVRKTLTRMIRQGLKERDHVFW